MSLGVALLGVRGISTVPALIPPQEEPIDGQTGVWLKQGASVIGSGMKMTGAVVSSGQSQYIYSRGITQSCTVVVSGFQYVNFGGKAIDTTVYWRQYITSGGYAEGTVLGSAAGAVPRVFMSTGAAASRVYIQTSVAALQIPAGAYVNEIYMSAGQLWVTGSADNIVMQAGTATVYPSGVASGIALSGGKLIVSSGGTALAVTSTGGTVNVLSGGSITYA